MYASRVLPFRLMSVSSSTRYDIHSIFYMYYFPCVFAIKIKFITISIFNIIIIIVYYYKKIMRMVNEYCVTRNCVYCYTIVIQMFI